MIATGAIVIRNGTRLPEALGLKYDSVATGWASVTNNPDGHRLEKALATAGWTFFYMAGAIRKIAFGFQRQNMVNAAMKRIIASVKLQGCNCLEIDGVAMRSFFGVPYVSVSAHSRHIQEAMVFSDH
jgi:hypothetical protein